MKFNTMLAASAVAIALAAPLAAHAGTDTWDLKLFNTSGTLPFGGDLTITTLSTFNTFGGLNIVDVTGFVGGDAVTLGPASAGTPPFESTSGDGAFFIDDVAWNKIGFAPLSNNGIYLLSLGAPGVSYNIFDPDTSHGSTVTPGAAGTLQALQFTPGAGLTESSLNAYTFVQTGGPTPGGVPEPTTWALMIVGFGGAGSLLRRQRQRSLGITQTT